MTSKQFSFLTFLTVSAGLVGGIISSRLFVSEPAFAQRVSQHEKRIIAEEFSLVDNEGRQRATLKTMKEGIAYLQFKNNEEKTSLSFATLPDGSSSISLISPDGSTKIELSLLGKYPQLEFAYKGTEYLTLCLSPSLFGDEYLTPKLILSNKTGFRTSLGIQDLGKSLELRGPTLSLSDSAGKERIALQVGIDGEPSLTFFDGNSKIRAVFGSTELEAIRTGVVEKRPASSLVLFDKDGKVIWQAPE